MSKIVIVGALAESLVNFRGDLIRSLIADGHEVTAMADFTDDTTCLRIQGLGASFRPYPVQRNGMNPRNDLKTFFALRSAFFELKPDIVLAYTIKPIIWGGLALRSLGFNTQFYALITGLGLAFQTGALKQKLLTSLVTYLYRIALVQAEKVIFQNKDNRQTFIDRHIVDSQRSMVVNGSGINLDKFSPSEPPNSKVNFLLISRLIQDKGIYEYAIAAKSLKKRYPDARFRLVGWIDENNPKAIRKQDLQNWIDGGYIDYQGRFDDVRPVIADSSVFVLPSYYPEGIPRTILEAMAMGRPVITTDTPGCRETVVFGQNGFLVPPRDLDSLANAMEIFINNPCSIREMGMRSREIAVAKFDVNKVNSLMLRTMGLLHEATA